MDAVNAMPIARSLGIPLLVTFHGWDATVRDEAFQRQSIALNLYTRRRSELGRAAARVLCVSEFIRRQVLAKGIPPHKTMVLYTGIDLRRFVPDLSVKRNPIVLFAARLVEKKGCEYLNRAMEKVQSKIEDAELVVIGDGPLRKRLEQQAGSKLRAFRFMGACSAWTWCASGWVRRAYSVRPALSLPPGMPRVSESVFAEAQAMGLPVASFASGESPKQSSTG